MFDPNQRKSLSFRLLASVINVCFMATFLAPARALAQSPTDLGMPKAGSMINLSSAYVPVLIKGLRVHPENPILFDFIVDSGNSGIKTDNAQLRTESEKLIKYFLASLTIPEQDLWVNLSPYEKNRIVPEQLGQTEMGRDMLAQDYILKQLTASLIYPEKDLGKEFWNKVYAKSQQLYGTNNIPVNTFNKVWIVADKAKVFVHDNTAFVVASHLKVMLEEDYVALNKNVNSAESPKGISTEKNTHAIGSQIIRDLVLPELEKEVNQGKNFSNLRQIFHSMILAAWYKKNLKEALLNQVYSNKSKINGVDVSDKTIKEQIYQEYLKAYKKGVFNYIKEDIQADGQNVPRKYFSGGIKGVLASGFSEVTLADPDASMFASKPNDGAMFSVSAVAKQDRALQVIPSAMTKVSGRLFKVRPEFSFMNSKNPHVPLTAAQLQTLVSNRDTRKIKNAAKVLELAKNNNIRIGADGALRLVDANLGTSVDLPQSQQEFMKQMKEMLGLDPRSIGEITSTGFLPAALRQFFVLSPASDPNSIEYVSQRAGSFSIKEGELPHFQNTSDKRFFQGKIIQNGQEVEITRFVSGVYHILHDIFGLKGVRIDMDKLSLIAEMGGLESSNGFMMAVVGLGSILSGMNLSEAEIFNLAIKLENYEAEGLTGGQGQFAFLTGMPSELIWLSYMNDGQYDALVRSLMSTDAQREFAKKAVLFQAGVGYKGGKKTNERTAGEINRFWMFLAELGHPEAMQLHLEKIWLKKKSIEAIARGDMTTFCRHLDRWVDIRNRLVRIGLEEAITGYEAHQKGPEAFAKVSNFAQELAKRVFINDDASTQFPEVHRFMKNGKVVPKGAYFNGEKLAEDKTVSGLEYLKNSSAYLYVSDVAWPIVERLRTFGLHAMALGAGGDGANMLLAVDPDIYLKTRRGEETEKEYIDRILREEFGIHKLDEAKVEGVMRQGEGLVQFWTDLEPGEAGPAQWRGLSEINEKLVQSEDPDLKGIAFQVPETPTEKTYDIKDLVPTSRGLDTTLGSKTFLILGQEQIQPGTKVAEDLRSRAAAGTGILIIATDMAEARRMVDDIFKNDPPRLAELWKESIRIVQIGTDGDAGAAFKSFWETNTSNGGLHSWVGPIPGSEEVLVAVQKGSYRGLQEEVNRMVGNVSFVSVEGERDLEGVLLGADQSSLRLPIQDVAMTTKTTDKELHKIVSEIGLQRIAFAEVDGQLVDFSDPAWKTRTGRGAVRYGYFELTGKNQKDVQTVGDMIDGQLEQGHLNNAIRLYTLNYQLFGREFATKAEAISGKLINAYKGDFRLVGKMGGSEIQWALATPAGIVSVILGEPTHKSVLGESLASLAAKPENSLDSIMQRLVAPMQRLVDKVKDRKIRDYFFTAPGFFAPDGSLVEAQKNIANMPAGFSFDVQIPEYLKTATGGSIVIKGRTVHDGTGHAFGDKSVYGPFALEDTIYGFWVGTGIASRVSPEGQVSFTGGAELNYLHNEGPHQAVWNPATGSYDIVFDTTKGRHPDFTTEGSPLFGRQDLEDRASGKAMSAVLNAEYQRVANKPLNERSAEEASLIDLMSSLGKTKIDRDVQRQMAIRQLPFMVRIFQERARELDLGIGALLGYLTTYPWEDGKKFNLKKIKIPVGGVIAQLNSLGLFEKVKAGVLEELELQGISVADRQIISNNIVMSPVDDDMRELLGGLPPKSFDGAMDAKVQVPSLKEMQQTLLSVRRGIVVDLKVLIGSESGTISGLNPDHLSSNALDLAFQEAAKYLSRERESRYDQLNDQHTIVRDDLFRIEQLLKKDQVSSEVIQQAAEIHSRLVTLQAQRPRLEQELARAEFAWGGELWRKDQLLSFLRNGFNPQQALQAGPIFVPRAFVPQEARMGLTPVEIKLLRAMNIENPIYVEAGSGINRDNGKVYFSDDQYREAGAEVLSHDDFFARANNSQRKVVVSIKEPQQKELPLLQNALLFTYLHLASNPRLTQELQSRVASAVGYETIGYTENGMTKTPVLKPASEAAGWLSTVRYAASILGGNDNQERQRAFDTALPGFATPERLPLNLQGSLKGQTVMVLGGGVAGQEAAVTAAKLGAEKVYITEVNDRRIEELRQIIIQLGLEGKITVLKRETDKGLYEQFPNQLNKANAIVGAVLVPGAKAPVEIDATTYQEVVNKRNLKFVADIAIDQGGNIAGSTERKYKDGWPVDQNGIVQFTVTNMPSALPLEVSFGIGRSKLAYLVALLMGHEVAIKVFPELEAGFNIHKGLITNTKVAQAMTGSADSGVTLAQADEIDAMVSDWKKIKQDAIGVVTNKQETKPEGVAVAAARDALVAKIEKIPGIQASNSRHYFLSELRRAVGRFTVLSPDWVRTKLSSVFKEIAIKGQGRVVAIRNQIGEQVDAINQAGQYKAEIIPRQEHVLVRFTDLKETGTSLTFMADSGFRIISRMVKGVETLRQKEDLNDLSSGTFFMIPWLSRLDGSKIVRNGRTIILTSQAGHNMEKTERDGQTIYLQTIDGLFTKGDVHGNPRHGVGRSSSAWKNLTIAPEGEGVSIQAEFETTDYPGLAEAFGHSKTTIKLVLQGNKLSIIPTVENLTTDAEAQRDGGYEVIADFGVHDMTYYSSGATTIQVPNAKGVLAVGERAMPTGVVLPLTDRLNVVQPQTMTGDSFDNTFVVDTPQGFFTSKMEDSTRKLRVINEIGGNLFVTDGQALFHVWDGSKTGGPNEGISGSEAVTAAANGPNRVGQVGGSRLLGKDEKREGAVTITVTDLALTAGITEQDRALVVPSSVKIGVNNQDNKVEVYKDGDEVGYRMARYQADLLKERNKTPKLYTLAIEPTGNTAIAFHRAFSEIVEQENIDCSRLLTANMDEYRNRRVYREYMERHLFENLREHGFSDENFLFFDGNALDSTKELQRYINKLADFKKKTGGKIQVVFGGIGVKGHIAFNEAIQKLMKPFESVTDRWVHNEFVFDEGFDKDRVTETIGEVLADRANGIKNNFSGLVNETLRQLEKTATLEQIAVLTDRVVKERVVFYLPDAWGDKIAKVRNGISVMNWSNRYGEVEILPASAMNARTRLVSLSAATIASPGNLEDAGQDITQMPLEAYTIGMDMINADDVERVMIAAVGGSKAIAVEKALEGQKIQAVPASLLQDSGGKVHYLLDEKAANKVRIDFKVEEFKNVLARDAALIGKQGGIDFNSRHMQMEEDGQKIDLHFDKAMLAEFQQGNFSGVRPVIINVTPIFNMRPLLGLAPAKEPEQLAKV